MKNIKSSFLKPVTVVFSVAAIQYLKEVNYFQMGKHGFKKKSLRTWKTYAVVHLTAFIIFKASQVFLYKRSDGKLLAHLLFHPSQTLMFFFCLTLLFTDKTLVLRC